MAAKAKFLLSTFMSSEFVDAMDMSIVDVPYHAFKTGVGGRHNSDMPQLQP